MKIDNLSLIDSSMWMHILKDERYLKLNNNDFIDKYGYPFLSLYNLVELAGGNNLNEFKNRLFKLSKLDGIHTISADNAILPGIPLDIIAFEIEAKYKYNAKNFKEVKAIILDKVKNIPIIFDSYSIPLLKQMLLKEKKRTEAVSFIQASTVNPYEFMSIETVYKRKKEIDDKKYAALIDRFVNIIEKRGKKTNQEKIEELRNEYINGIINVRNRIDKYNNFKDYLISILGTEIDVKKTFNYYMNACLFKKITLMDPIKQIIEENHIKNIQMDDSPIFSFQRYLFLKLRELIKVDKKRKIEGSNTIDVYLASYSLYLNVIADKRMYPILEAARKNDYKDIDFEKIDYNRFLCI